MIELTKTAIQYLHEFAENEGINHLNIRISIKGFGCAGLGYDMLFDDLDPTDMDEIIKQEDIIIYVDCISASYMQEGVLVDFVKSKYSSGFSFMGKGDEYKSCGCGSSFSV